MYLLFRLNSEFRDSKIYQKYKKGSTMNSKQGHFDAVYLIEAPQKPSNVSIANQNP